MKLLIADDDRVSRLLLRTILNRLPNCTIVEAADGNAVWEMLQQPPLPDVCILDNLMPGLTGLALLERIRSEPRLMRLPVIICSSSRELDCIERAARLRARHYILKPYQAQFVLDTVLQAQRQLQDRHALDQPDDVCQRLSLTRVDFTALLAELLAALEPGFAKIAAALSDGALAAALLETNALRGACAHLGARTLAEDLARLEAALRHALTALQDDTTPDEIRSDRIARLLGLLEHLRHEATLLSHAAQPHLGLSATATPSSPAAASV